MGKEVMCKKQSEFNSLRVMKVSHGFDEKEGTGYFENILIITDSPKAVLLQWCFETFGPPLKHWYDDEFYVAWILSDKLEGTAFEYVLSNNDKINVAVVSRRDYTWAGLPSSQYPCPLSDGS